MTMLLDAPRYAAVNAQVRSLFARLIDPLTWASILAAPDLPTLQSLLLTTWYADTLTVTALLERGEAADLERALRQHLVQATRTPLGLMRGAAYEALDWYWRRFEVDNLKTVLRAVHYQAPPGVLARSLIPLGRASTLPWPAIIAADSVLAVVDRLRGTLYGRSLAQALPQYRREQSLFALEVALDLAYYQRLLDDLNKLHGRDRAEATRFLGTWVDYHNLLWAYRYRIFAQFSPEEILNYTLHRGLRVDAEVVRAIAVGAPLATIAQAIWGRAMPQLDLLRDQPERQALAQLETIFLRLLYTQAQQARGGYPLHLGVVLAYLVLVECEVRDLISIVEGKAYGWSVERIRPYLIGERG